MNARRPAGNDTTRRSPSTSPPTELLELEHARLQLRRIGVVLDRGRLVREAIAILLADLDARGDDSLVVRNIRASMNDDDDESGRAG